MRFDVPSFDAKIATSSVPTAREETGDLWYFNVYRQLLEACNRKASSCPDRKCNRSYRKPEYWLPWWRRAVSDSWRHCRRLPSSFAVPVTSSVDRKLAGRRWQVRRPQGARHVTGWKTPANCRNRLICRCIETTNLLRRRRAPDNSTTHHTVMGHTLMPSFHHSVAVLPFRSYRCRCRWERKCWKRLSVYIWMKRPQRWLVARLRQNGKNRIYIIGFDPICYGTTVKAQRQVGTATAERQRNGGNQAIIMHRINGLTD